MADGGGEQGAAAGETFALEEGEEVGGAEVPLAVGGEAGVGVAGGGGARGPAGGHEGDGGEKAGVAGEVGGDGVVAVRWKLQPLGR